MSTRGCDYDYGGRCTNCGDEIPKGYIHNCWIRFSGLHPTGWSQYKTLFGPTDAIAESVGSTVVETGDKEGGV